jgi:pyruvate,water dikinase
MDRWITDWERGESDWMPYYTRANAGETLPDPASPLTPGAGDRAAAA